MMLFQYGVDFMPGLRPAHFGCCTSLHLLWTANLCVAFGAYLSKRRHSADAAATSAAAVHPKGRAVCNNYAPSNRSTSFELSAFSGNNSEIPCAFNLHVGLLRIVLGI
jgi:hypothetical protein